MMEIIQLERLDVISTCDRHLCFHALDAVAAKILGATRGILARM